MGPYCRFCNQRCFVVRLLPDDSHSRAGQYLAMATCPGGMAHDRERTGYTHRECVNPVTGEVHA